MSATTSTSIETSQTEPLPGEKSAQGPASPWAERFDRLETWLAGASDYLNPILVKETRQALKSRHFTFTFVLLLGWCWLATIGGVAMVGPGIYYAAAGPVLLKAYYFVLILPLAIVVPFTAFRSLTGEREENTYDLLRVSTLAPRQIVSGKLASAMVQMGVYLSAVAPCLAFTYLLRGIDVVTIAFLLLYVSLGCCGLSMLGLFAAALAQRKQGQVLSSVGFVTVLLGCGWAGVFAANEFLDQGAQYIGQWEFWALNGTVFTVYATTFALCFLATVALITFRSENRSTALRWAMVVQQTAYVGWMAFWWIVAGYEEVIPLLMFCFAAIYWFAMGTLLTSEVGELSHRVRRRLPQSVLGRVFLGWFNPGPASGYFFAVANLTSMALVVVVALVCTDWIPLPTRGRMPTESIVASMLLLWSYVVIYLGLGKLVVAAVRKFTAVPAVAGFLIHVILLAAGCGVPFALQMSLRSWRNAGFTPLQWSNPVWSFFEVVDARALNSEVFSLLLVVGGLAFCLLVLNLPAAAREIRQVRVALPQRVAEDEAVLHPVVIKPQSPWEEEA